MNFWRKTPNKPAEMNGDTAALWGFLLHLNSRVDTLYVFLGAILLSVVATLVTVILK